LSNNSLPTYLIKEYVKFWLVHEQVPRCTNYICHSLTNTENYSNIASILQHYRNIIAIFCIVLGIMNDARIAKRISRSFALMPRIRKYFVPNINTRIHCMTHNNNKNISNFSLIHDNSKIDIKKFLEYPL